MHLEELEKTMKTSYLKRDLIGETPGMDHVRELISAVSQNHSTVLILGESGTGKELVARGIHRNSERAGHPFVAVNCGGVSKTLLESELFGHVKGAFTGALYDTLGFFRAAEGGTIFLDEILEMDLDLQSKLLRVLQEREVRPVGSSKTYKINVRILAATNNDPEEAIREGRLRQDLYYRLDVVSVKLLPLRERKADIPRLLDYFLEKYAFEYDVPRKEMHPGTSYMFLRHSWPGNVRELENVIERAYALNVGEVILPDHLPTSMVTSKEMLEIDEQNGEIMTLDEAQKMAIIQALAAAGGNKSKAADFLHIHRNRLARMMRRFTL